MRSPSRRLALVAATVLALVATGCSNGSDGNRAGATSTTADADVNGGPTTTGPLGTRTVPVPDGIRIEVLSSQPDRVSGDDARVRVTPQRGAALADVAVTLDDRDVTKQLRPTDGALEGVITGFVEGNNTLVATARGKRTVQRVRAWPRSGPIISGPHLPLLACSTVEHGLGEPTDRDCSAPTKVTWRYITTAGKIADLPSAALGGTSPPADLATARIGGKDVPLYVRDEVGVINRSIYEVSSIDATPGDDDPTGPGWNGKLLYRFGGGCGTTFGQGTSLTTPLEPAYLSQGYALATATFNTFQVQCNDVLSAETTMMVKERVIEEFGQPRFTIGEGASGGSIQLHLMAQNYPGLVNGIVALLPFPDALSIAPGVTDCGLLLHYYGTPAGTALTDAQRRAINGHATTTTCHTWASTFLAAIDPTSGCDPKIPAGAIYDPEANRGGLRCTLQDANRNQLGTDPDTGFAARPLDNVGVQYGLDALNAGTISVEQFLDLNAAIGGYDLDGRIVAEREEADPEVVLHAYETGRISMGGGDQLDIPIIDLNPYTDPTGDIHDRFRAFSLRDRLTRGGTAEDAPGFQIWTLGTGASDLGAALGDATSGGVTELDAVAAIDRWLTALAEDHRGGPMADVLRRNRPADAVDRCLPSGAAAPIAGPGTYDEPGPCHDDFPLAGDPRTAAGQPRSDEVLKCDLKPIDPADYDLELTADQLRRLAAIFSSGVCDYSAPAETETVPATPDRSYEDAPAPGQSA